MRVCFQNRGLFGIHRLGEEDWICVRSLSQLAGPAGPRSRVILGDHLREVKEVMSICMTLVLADCTSWMT